MASTNSTASQYSKVLNTSFEVGLYTTGLGLIGIVGSWGLQKINESLAAVLLDSATTVTGIGIVTTGTAWLLKKILT